MVGLGLGIGLTRGGGAVPYDLPAAFSWTPPFTVFRTSAGTYSHDYSPVIPTGVEKHVDPTNGSNSNTGDSFAQAYKTTDQAKNQNANIIRVYPSATGTVTYVDRLRK